MNACAQSAPRTRRSLDETGGAVTLLVVLMVPVVVLAAVVAAAAPRRLAAESAVDAAADNLASLAVVWRDAQARAHADLGWFFPDCAPSRAETPDDELAALESELRPACEALTESLLAGLSARGFDGNTLTGFYSSAYTAATNSHGDHPVSLPCHAGGRTLVTDAVHLGLAADWATADWAASQVWPRGLRIAAETVGTTRVTAAGAEAIADPACGSLLALEPLHAHPRGGAAARQLAESLPTRTAFGS